VALGGRFLKGNATGGVDMRSGKTIEVVMERKWVSADPLVVEPGAADGPSSGSTVRQSGMMWQIVWSCAGAQLGMAWVAQCQGTTQGGEVSNLWVATPVA
jgi:hypothetical protein